MLQVKWIAMRITRTDRKLVGWVYFPGQLAFCQTARLPTASVREKKYKFFPLLFEEGGESSG